MNYLYVSFVTMLFVFITYVSFIWSKYGVLSSISESYYRLPTKLSFLFTLFCWGFAIPAIIIGVDLTNNYLMFLAGGGIMFVGAAAAFKETLTKNVHMIGAALGIIFSQLSIAFDFHMYYVNILFFIAALLVLVFRIKNHIWWIELLAFSSICYVLGSKI